ncbi:MAG TPA: hypothetical protein DIW81_20390, partial [Planctomycetaceae bacterium]|nr:hypothetical protein [Planctomycetaceae bacterium]
YKALDLPLELFAREPGVQFAQRADTERAFRNVLGYRLYRDQKRGWRITSPNLEQCGLLKIEYPSLMELCQSEEHWQGTHATLTGASPATRERISRALLDYLRRELAIDVDYLTTEFFERLQQQSSQRLREPWAIDEQERAEIASAVFPRGRRPHDRQFYTYLSGRSGFGIYLGRPTTLPEFDRSASNLRLVDKDSIIQNLFSVLANAGYVVRVVEPSDDEDDQPGYQLSASAMQWQMADGTVAFHDPIRVPNPPQEGGRTNDFFVNFYRTVAGELRGLEAREHTAQVPYQESGFARCVSQSLLHRRHVRPRQQLPAACRLRQSGQRGTRQRLRIAAGTASQHRHRRRPLYTRHRRRQRTEDHRQLLHTNVADQLPARFG